jgi:ribulose-5-phosphate 4-epimerase/fuculose-1-phosphate aldolase
MMISAEFRQEMVTALESASRLGLCIGKISEASIRIQENIYLVTKKGCGFHQIADNDLILAAANSDSVIDENQNPNHWDWHLEIYETDNSVKAIVLAQPAAVMAMASKMKLPPRDLLPDAAEIIGQIQLSTPDLQAISQEIEHSKQLIIPGIGILSWGETLSEIIINLEIIKRWCEISLMANI